MEKVKRLCVFMIGLLFAGFFLARITTSARAEEVPTSGDFYGLDWSYDESTQTLTITGNGEMYDYLGGEENEAFPWWDIEGIKTVIIGEGITHIGDYAFTHGGSDIISVSIPRGVTSIGNYAFDRCWSLESINLPNGLIKIGEGAFCSSSIKTIVLPKSLKSIGNYAFAETRLNKIIIPNSVTYIGRWAFELCSDLEKVTFSNKLAVLSEGMFYDCPKLKHITIPSSIITIESGVFEKSGLTSITIPKNVKNLKGEIFMCCVDLKKIKVESVQLKSVSRKVLKGVNATTSVILPKDKEKEYKKFFIKPKTSGIFHGIKWKYDSITQTFYISGNGAMIDEDFLYDTTKPYRNVLKTEDYPWYDWGSYAKRVVVGEGITYIGLGTFSDFCKIESVSLPQSLIKIGSGAFGGCESLGKVYIPEGVTTICAGAFGSCSSLKRVIIPNSVTTVEAYAFWYCESLESIIFPDSITYLGEHLFNSCSNLQYVRLPSSLTNIPAGLFAFCKNIRIVDIPECVTQIGEGAFRGSGIETLVIPRNVESLEWEVFEQCKSLKKIIINSEKLETLHSKALIAIDKEVIIEAPISKADKYPTLFESAGLNPEIQVIYK